MLIVKWKKPKKGIEEGNKRLGEIFKEIKDEKKKQEFLKIFGS